MGGLVEGEERVELGLNSVSYLRGRGGVCRIAAGDGGGCFEEVRSTVKLSTSCI